MDHIGMDVHKKERQLCILAEGGELTERRIRTEPQRFAAVLGDRLPLMSANRRMMKPRETDATTQQDTADTNSTEGSPDLTRPAAS